MRWLPLASILLVFGLLCIQQSKYPELLDPWRELFLISATLNFFIFIFIQNIANRTVSVHPVFPRAPLKSKVKQCAEDAVRAHVRLRVLARRYPDDDAWDYAHGIRNHARDVLRGVNG